ncbi:MAG: hypothetical protein KF686_01965 [Ramlibacter sp.]|nr:hypothetical protein [Ramlibacter sp.]
MNRLVCAALLALTLALAACGGGQTSTDCSNCSPSTPVIGGGDTGGNGTAGGGSGGDGTGSTGGDGSGSSGSGSGSTGGDGSGSGGSGGSGSGSSGSGSGSTGGDGSGSSGSGSSGSGSSGSGSDGTGVAGGVGSGGTGVSGDGGVGSGGTGIGIASVSIGSIDGFGSVIVNGIRHDIGNAVVSLGDASSLQLGMTVRLTGTVSASLTGGTASTVVSAAQLRGKVTIVDTASATFKVMGTTVTIDSATLFDGVSGVSSLIPGDLVQVYGLPGEPGTLRATRIELKTGTSSTLLTGVVQNLATGSSTFRIGDVTVDYSRGIFASPLSAGALANGLVVRVIAYTEPAANLLNAVTIEPWYVTPAVNGTPANLGGIVTQFAGLGDFRLGGVAIDASGALVTGGPSGSIGNGVKLEVTGTINGSGTLVVTKLKIRYVPGTGGPAQFSATGAIGQFTSVARFRVQGQLIDASGPAVVFTGGTAAQLRNGVKVTAKGSQVISGVLVADEIIFE